MVLLLFSLFILMFKLSQIWPVGTSSGWLLCSLILSLVFFEHFLSQYILDTSVLSLPKPFLMKLLLLYWRITFGSRDLCSRCAHDCWVALLPGLLRGHNRGLQI